MAMAKCNPGCQCGRHQRMLKRDKQKACVECGSLFLAARSDASFCSDSCWRQAYARDHKDAIRARQNRWQAANREKRREILQRYEEKHGERDRAAKRQRHAEAAADPERAAAQREWRRQYYEANKDRLREYQRQRRARMNPEIRSAERRAQHGTEWEPLFRSMLDAQDGRCYLCGDALRLDIKRGIHLDHDHACCEPPRTCEKCRRGLSCPDCNYLIARANDDPVRLRRIADNLEAAMLRLAAH